MPAVHGVAVPWWLIAGLIIAGVLYLFTRSSHSNQDDASRKPARANANNTPDDDSRDDR